jgi:hypothetical protein
MLLLAGLLGLTLYDHYWTSRDLQRLCDLIGPHEASPAIPTAPQQEIDNICTNHQPDTGF